MIWELLPPQQGPAKTASSCDIQSTPRGHRYSTTAIHMAVELVFFCNVSLRAAARTFIVMDRQDNPTFCTIRHWVLRLGLYELQRAKEQASDWVFIVDATIGVGEHKALVILGGALGAVKREGI